MNKSTVLHVKNKLKNILKVLVAAERKRFFVLLLLDIIISIIDILSLALLLWIIRFYIQPAANHDLSFFPAWLNDKRSVSLIAVFLVFFAIKNWAGYLISRAHFNFISGVAIRISRNNLSAYQRSAFGEFINTDSSVHIRKICFQPFEFAQHMLSGVKEIITQLSLILIAIIAILIFDAKLFLLLLLILLPPVIVVFWFIKKRLGAAKKNIQLNNERSFQHLLDALKGYVEGNIYDRNDFFLQRFVSSRKKFSAHLFDSLALQGMPGRVIEIFAVLGLFILIVIANWYGNSDGSMLITIGAFMAAAYKIIPGIVKVINISGQIKAYEFSPEDLRQNNATTGAQTEKAAATEINSIEFKNVSFQYGGQPVLKQFSFALKKGDFAGISGESGRGKTTILNLLLGFLQATEGEICINNEPTVSIDIKNYWTRIAYVRQQGFFIHDTLLRNITLEETGHNEANLQYAINISGLDKVMQKFPNGPDTIITENGRNISGGQQQRISIARALYKKASLILLDEPFNELDEEATHSMLAHFKELSLAGITVVMITHDKKSLSYCNKIISLDEAG